MTPCSLSRKPSEVAARLGSVSALAGALTAAGGASELLGLVLVVKEIAEDRARARRLFSPRRRKSKPKRRYPGRVSPGPTTGSPFSSMRPAADQQRELEVAVRKIGAMLANGLIDMRKALDAQHDQAVDELRAEIVAADEELRGHLLYVLAGSVRDRMIGAGLLGVGLVLEIAGAVISAVAG
jgi:hypothetical protein